MTSSILKKLIPWNPFPYVRSYFQTEIREEILKDIDVCLLYFKGELIHLASKQSVENVELNCEAIAQASKQLLANEPKKKQQRSSIALFLPLTEFIYTQYAMPSVDSLNVKAALKYQREELLPASKDDLELTVSHLKNKDNFALWFSAQKIQNYEQAFQQAGLSLAAILPRLALLTSKSSIGKMVTISLDEQAKNDFFREQADGYLAQFGFSENSLTQLGHITEQDIKNDSFKQEWETQFGAIDNTLDCLKNKSDWFAKLSDKRFADNFKLSHYAYFPQQIKNSFKSRGHLRNSRVVGLLAFILMFALAIPFVINQVRYWKYEAKYQSVLTQAKTVQEMRAKVLEYEDTWALYLNYPRVDALEVISRLNKIIPLNSWISNFQIKNGYVEIDGFSPDPAAILEVISAQSDFNEVAFNKNIRAQRGQDKERFGITFHIRGLNVEQYEAEYFTDE